MNALIFMSERLFQAVAGVRVRLADSGLAPCIFGKAAILLLVGAVLTQSAVAAETKLPPPASTKIDFVRDIQPILAKHCYSCHGPDKQEKELRWDMKAAALKGGTSGPAIVPGRSTESRMIRLVAGLEKDLVMPKKGERLSLEQIGLLRAWIDQGVSWPDSAANAAAPDKSDWWSFKPAKRPPLPALKTGEKIKNPIDVFIAAKLAQEKLTASSEADRRTLIRRLTFDLTGLPPTREEVEHFLNDREERAYERLVDRLLASPRYGERWARHWLDTVHYADTHGYDKDKTRPFAWPYRDYVIRSFNGDKPYSRFVQEQLAGDVLFPDEPDGIVALGFIAAGPWDFVGHAELPIEKTDGLIARYNDRDDMVMTTISTFESLTVHCARCHNHKFDPITQKDYYSLQAAFSGVDRHDRPFDGDKELHIKRRLLLEKQKPLDDRYTELTSQLSKLTSPEIEKIDEQVKELKQELRAKFPNDKKSPGNGYHSGIEKMRDITKWVQVDLGKVLPITEVRLIPARPIDFADTPGFGFPLRFRVDVSAEPTFAAPQSIAVHTSEDFKNAGDAPVPFPASGKQGQFVRVTATRLWERTSDYVFALSELQVMVDGTNAAFGASVSALDSIEEGLWAKKHLVDGFDSRQKLGGTTPPEKIKLEKEIQALTDKRGPLMESLLDEATRKELGDVSNRLAQINQQIAALPAPEMVYAAASDFKPGGSFVPPKKPRPVHLLAKGDVKRPGELMKPAGIAAVPGPSAAFEIPEGANESVRRAALAEWITSPKNMLTRRSIVNRVWHYHFGRGLVETANDFGHMGSLPTHPELLDWLAFWFLENGESLKKLHRLIVTSSTYKQSSASNAESIKLDAENRYLWRMNRARLDAESIHDAMLHISGKLDLKMGGPAIQQFYFKDDHSPIYDYTLFDVDSPAACRRSIYRFIVRSVPDPFMDSLDCPNSSILTPKRNVTTTSLQALSVLNDPFVLKQCEHFAARLEKAGKLDKQIQEAYRLALNRLPTAKESETVRKFAMDHGMPNLCRLLFNLSEFVFVD